MATMRRKIGLTTMMAAAVLVLAAQTAFAQRQSGIQRTPDGARVLVSKDVGGQRYAITLNTGDGTVTGNVFSTDGSAPQFISCAPTGQNAFDCRVAPTCDPSASRQSGIQRASDGAEVLVSKDVSGQRFAITQNVDSTLTGNVFTAATGSAQFLFCTPQNGGFSCAVADSCTASSCASQFATLPGTITLPETFFTLPESCVTYGPPIAITLPKNFFVPDPEVMAAAARQVIVNNPYRATQVSKTGLVNDLTLATRLPNGPAKVGDTAQCPVNGQQRLTKCESFQLDSGPATLSTIVFEGCSSGSATAGFKVQRGTVEIILPNATICLLLTPAELPIGVEITEQRRDFETTFFTGPGVGRGIDLENSTSLITHQDVCVGVDTAFSSNVRRDAQISSRSMIDNVPGTGDFVIVDQEFDGVTIRREFSDCVVRTTTLSSGLSGEIATVDGRFGESYATRFDDLRFAFDTAGGETTLSIDGGLLDVCTEISGDRSGNRSFGYRTLTPTNFAQDFDGCPRGGAFEISAEGVVIGQLSFGDAGGVTLTPLSGPPITFAGCHDPALLLKSCAANTDM